MLKPTMVWVNLQRGWHYHKEQPNNPLCINASKDRSYILVKANTLKKWRTVEHKKFLPCPVCYSIKK